MRSWKVRTLVGGDKSMALRKYIIERDIPKVGTFEREKLRGAAAKSNQVLQLGPDIQWVESYVADDRHSVSISRKTRQSSASTRRSVDFLRLRSQKYAS